MTVNKIDVRGETNEISSQNISSILNDVQPQNDLSRNGKQMPTTSTFSSETGYLDFSAILNAPSYDPTAHPLTLTRCSETSSVEMEPEEDKKMMNPELKNIFKESLQKFRIVQENNQQSNEVGAGEDKQLSLKNNIDKIPDLGKIFVNF